MITSENQHHFVFSLCSLHIENPKNITLGICELPNDLSKYFGRGKIAKDARKAVLTNTFDGELLTFSVRILNDFYQGKDYE